MAEIMGHVLWLVPDTIITARLSLPIKGGRRRKKRRGRKTEGTKEKHRERETTTAPTVPFSPSPAFFSFRFPSSPQPTKEHTSPSTFPSLFIPSSSSLSQPPAASLVFFEDFGHRTPKPPTAFPSHQQPTIFPHATTLLPQLIIFLPHAALPLRETVVH